MYDKCPSKSMRNLKAKIYKCRNCGGEVEMFSDELRTRCKKCRRFIFKDQLPYCIEGYINTVIVERRDVDRPARRELGYIA